MEAGYDQRNAGVNEGDEDAKNNDESSFWFSLSLLCTPCLISLGPNYKQVFEKNFKRV
jgi:hypothetical protein